MNRNPVDSGHLKSVGYEPITHTLEIEFVNGSIYRGTVPAEHHQAMIDSGSVGEYYHRNIKNSYNMKRV